MRKIFTLIAASLLAGNAFATDYSGKLLVNLDGTLIANTTTTISVDGNEATGKYTLSLKNFSFSQEGETLGVGNIVLNDVEGQTFADGTVRIATSQSINITEGDDENIPMWTGPYLGAVPIDMVGVIRGGNFYTTININSVDLGVIKVVFGDNALQIGNSDFETFHTATYGDATSDEPDYWHSFMSCTGSYASFVSGTPHTFISDEVRPGSTGKSSLKLTSGVVWGASANGTITTGRLQAGNMFATNKNNCAFLDLSKTDVDAKGDPFNAQIAVQPDSIVAWVKYTQGTPTKTKSHPYATISATITDGTYYQDPENATFTNIVAKASNAKIVSNDSQWQRISIPFDYDSYASNNAETKAILVTMSTNAYPGGGSNDSKNPDVMLIDDVQLVYNAGLKSLKIDGTDVPSFSSDVKEYTISGTKSAYTADDIDAVVDGRQAVVVAKTIESNGSDVKATVTVSSLADYEASNTYTVNITVPTAINVVENNTVSGAATLYNIGGQRISDNAQKGVYIVRQADGKVVKVLKK